MRNRLVWLAVLGIAMYASGGAAIQCDGPDDQYVVETVYGKVSGTEVTEKVIRFANIPFAKAPVGELRFRAPQPPDRWEGVLDGTELGPVAVQSRGKAYAERQSEDCLRLTLWTPGLDDKPRPVMVNIHGGGFTQGGATGPNVDGTQFAQRGDVVLVNIQYRLGALGWLYLDEFGGEAYRDAKNAGLLDQVLALRWVQENIARFGGDPGNVTIFGCSAGSASVTALMVMPRARGLFHKAIAESGTLAIGRPVERARRFTEDFVEVAGAKTMADLQALDADEILEATAATARELDVKGGPVFGPVLDGDLLPTDPQGTIADGGAAEIPLLHGTTRDECHLWLLCASSEWDDPEGNLERRLREGEGVSEGELAIMMEAVARARPEAEKADRYLHAMTWEAFRYPQTILSEAQSRHADTWMYLLTWSSPAIPKAGPYHGLDVSFVFCVDSSFDERLDSDDAERAKTLARQMQDAWVSFARDGDPNHDGLPEWPKWEAATRATMLFQEEPRVVEDPGKELRLTWQAIHRARQAE